MLMNYCGHIPFKKAKKSRLGQILSELKARFSNKFKLQGKGRNIRNGGRVKSMNHGSR